MHSSASGKVTAVDPTKRALNVGSGNLTVVSFLLLSTIVPLATSTDPKQWLKNGSLSPEFRISSVLKKSNKINKFQI